MEETLEVRFSGQDHQVDVQTFGYSLINFSALVKEVNSAGGNEPIEIVVNAPERGSVLVHLTAFYVQNKEVLDGLATGGTDLGFVIAGVRGCYALHKFISGKKVQGEEKKGGETKIILEDGSQMIFADKIVNIYQQNPAIPNYISQQFTALSEDPAVESFEVKHRQDVVVEVQRDDFSRLATKQLLKTDETEEQTISAAHLYINKTVFEKNDRKWEFYWMGNKISANIRDEDFFRAIDEGESFAKGDQLVVDLQINKILDRSLGAFVNSSYTVVKVQEHIKRPATPPLV